VPSRNAPTLPDAADVVALTAALVDVPSVSGDEEALADAVEQLLRGAGHLRVTRTGNTVAARTELGRSERVVLAGHLDTVPAAGNDGARLVDGPEGPELAGLGSVDMKGGDAVALRLALDIAEPTRDVSFLFYECEEVEAARNGLAVLAAADPAALSADLAILLEPTGGVVEGGCQGTLRVAVTTTGARAHTARGWTGSNAIHAAAPVLDRLRAGHDVRRVVEGLEYREGLQAVGIAGGVSGNVVPDRCTVLVNHRFAPDHSEAQALGHVRAVFDGFDVELVDSAPGARPGLDRPAAADFAAVVAPVAGPPRAKYGWTDVARFAALGIPALNFGPGDPSRSHTPGESVPTAQLTACERLLRDWLTGRVPGDSRSAGRTPGTRMPADGAVPSGRGAADA